MTRWIAVSIIAAAAAGCGGQLNPAYCRAHPEDPDCPRIDAGTEIDAVIACDSPDDCSAPTDVCDLSQGACVECTENTHCSGNEPLCDTGPNVCRGCTAHAQCASQLCLPDGSCAATTDVTYVVGGALASTTCTLTAPCPNFDAALMSPPRDFFKVSGAVMDDATALFDSRNATIYAEPGSSISRTTAGDVMDIKGNSNVTIHGLTIRDATNNTGDDGLYIHEAATVALYNVKIHGNDGNGITFAATNLTVVDSTIHTNTGSGIAATAGTLTVRDSIVYDNTSTGITATTTGLVTIGSSVIAFNDGGGLSLASDYAVTNSIISANGSTSSLVGGVQLSTANAGAVFQFNTVANNVSTQAAGNGVRGIICVSAVTVTNSIFTGAIDGVCTVTYSLTTTALGGTNKVGAPLFVNVGTDPLVATFYRIMATSPAQNSANPSPSIAVDIDGDPRSATAPDMGADEAP